jgi:hypothetical protein
MQGFFKDFKVYKDFKDLEDLKVLKKNRDKPEPKREVR